MEKISAASHAWSYDQFSEKQILHVDLSLLYVEEQKWSETANEKLLMMIVAFLNDPKGGTILFGARIKKGLLYARGHSYSPWEVESMHLKIR